MRLCALLNLASRVSTPGSPGKPGELGDGWGEMLGSLEHFDFQKYGIDYADQRYRTESGQLAMPGVTDKDLEEMTAMADGKVHAPEEGTPRTATPVAMHSGQSKPSSLTPGTQM